MGQLVSVGVVVVEVEFVVVAVGLLVLLLLLGCGGCLVWWWFAATCCGLSFGVATAANRVPAVRCHSGVGCYWGLLFV